MVRTQLYLPEKLYKELKRQAKAQDMTFASYVRVFLEEKAIRNDKKEKELYKAFPFMKYAGTFDWGPGAADNDEIDKAVYGF